MQLKKQILIKTNTKDEILFDVDGHSQFVQLVYDLDSIWKTWIRVGEWSVIRKNTIISAYYFPNGYNARNALDKTQE